MTTQKKRDSSQPKEAVRKRPIAQPADLEQDAVLDSVEQVLLQRAVVDPSAASPADMLALQRGYGNRAATSLIQTKLTVGAAGDQYEQEADRVANQVMSTPAPADGQQMADGGESGVQRQTEEEEEVQTKPLSASISSLVQRQEEEEELQTKSLSASASPLVQRQEEEEEVQTKSLSASVSPLVQRQEEEEEVQTKSLSASVSPLVQRQEEEEEVQTKPLSASASLLVQRQAEEEEELQTKRVGQHQAIQRQEEEEEVQTKTVAKEAQATDGSFEAGSGLENNLTKLKGEGSPLPSEVRSFMEPRFGADFSNVRVHTGEKSTQLNRSLNSRAFTHGQDIHFRGSDYSPETTGGKELLAHELTHTLQQGATNRIQGWWPRGHKLVTEVALDQGALPQIYDEPARKYLIDRSPDIDFIQDQIVTMDQGIKLGKASIDLYEQLIASGQDERAEAMWKNNDLHYRKPAYMMSHGEGGRYKDSDPAAINEAMTRKLVDAAVEKWDWTKSNGNVESLSRLSDALHQAEDRGSHGEGREFTGHDSRLNLFKWMDKSDRERMPWEEWHNAPPQAAEGKWEPDNFSVNKGGGVKGIGFAQGALNLFARKVREKEGGGPEKKIELNPDLGTKKRSAAAKSFLPFMKSSNLLVGAIGKSGKGWRKGKKKKTLEKLLKQRDRLIVSGELKKGDYEETLKDPEVKNEVTENPQALEMVTQGQQFYETGAGFSKAFEDAENQFRIWKRKRRWSPTSWGKGKGGGLKKKDRIKQSKAYYLAQTANVKDTAPKPQLLIERSAQILKAYEQVFGNRLYNIGRTPYPEVNEVQKK